MDRRRGFTIIELLITITVLLILATLAVVNLRGTQNQARDAKRAADISVIARGLEQRYNNGMSQSTTGAPSIQLAVGGSCSSTQALSTSPGLVGGTYPSTEEMNYIVGQSDTAFCPAQTTSFITDDLPGVDPTNLKTPSNGTLVMATSATSPLTLSSTDANYYYQPLTSANALCASISTPCVKFFLYYVGETTGTQSQQSSHQQ